MSESGRLKFPDEPIRVPSDREPFSVWENDDSDEGDPDERSCWTCGGDGYHECEEWDCLPNCRGSGDAKDVRYW